MSNCDRCKDLFADALYDEMQSDDNVWFRDHLATCEQCAAEFSEMKSTLEVMSRKKRPELSDEFWERYHHQLNAKLAAEKKSAAAPDRKLWTVLRPIPAWALQAAAAVIVLLAGVWIGRTMLPNSIPVASVAKPTPANPQLAQPVSITDRRAQQFLDRSEVLILGLMHNDPQSEDLTHPKQVSRDLVHEARYLKTQLNSHDQRKLRRLVSDLELILVQIANMKAEHGVPEIELVRSGIDRKAILFQINLEQMRMAGTTNRVEKPSSSAGKNSSQL